MKAICWILLLCVFACQECKQTAADNPNAIRDLLIDRLFWQKKPNAQPQGSLVGVHRFTITNTSQHYAYQHIKIRFDYYDRNYRRVDSTFHSIERAIEPRSAIKIDSVETKLTKEEAISATATVVTASAN